MINVIFHTVNVKSKYKKSCNDFPSPAVVYNLRNSISNKIFSINIFVASIKFNAVLESERTLPCHYTIFQLVDKYH